MTDTLFDLTLKVAIELGVVRQGVATGGATNTVIDTNLLASIDEDYFNEGTVWITDTTDDLAPKGEFEIVTDFTATGQILTLQAALTAAPAAGDRYAVAIRRYRLNEIIQQINNALYLDGYIAVDDITSITTVANQREYTLPQAASLDLRMVEIQTNVVASNNQYKPLYNYAIQRTAGGTADILLLNQEYASGRVIKLTYATQHAALQVATDELNDAIHPDRIVFEAASKAMRNYADRTRLKHLDDTIQLMESWSELAKQRHPLPSLPGRQSKIGIISRSLEI